LCAGLTALAERPRSALLQVDVEIDEMADSLVSAFAADQLFAIAREATSNVVRHAQARSVSLRLRREDGRMVLAIRDDGRGFNADDAAASGGQGLAIMSERARTLGAQLRLVTGNGSGTEVRVELALGSTAGRAAQPP
jgi:signal transduction histidine kinase